MCAIIMTYKWGNIMECLAKTENDKFRFSKEEEIINMW